MGVGDGWFGSFFCGQGRGLEAAVKGKNNGQPEGLCCWLEKNGGGPAAWRR